MSIKFANDDDLKNAAKTFRQHAAGIEQQFNSILKSSILATYSIYLLNGDYVKHVGTA